MEVERREKKSLGSCSSCSPITLRSLFFLLSFCRKRPDFFLFESATMTSMTFRMPVTRYECSENPKDGRDRGRAEGNGTFDVDVDVFFVSSPFFLVTFPAAFRQRGARFSRKTRCAHAENSPLGFDLRRVLEQKRRPRS